MDVEDDDVDMEDDDVDVGMLPDREGGIELPPVPTNPRRLGYNITYTDVARGSYMHGLFLKDGMPHGHHRAYRENGMRLYDYVYNKGVPAGTWWDWNHKGVFDALRSFDECGRPHGTWVEWREDSMFDMYNWVYVASDWDHGLPCQLYKHSFHEALFWTVPVQIESAAAEVQQHYIHIQEDIEREMGDDITTSKFTIVCVSKDRPVNVEEPRRTKSGTYFYGQMPSIEQKENEFFLHGPNIYDPGDGQLTYRIDCEIVAQWTDIEITLRGTKTPIEFYESYFVERVEKTFEKGVGAKTLDELIEKCTAFIEKHRCTSEASDEEN